MSSLLSPAPTDVRIVAGRRKLIWNDSENGQQKAYRPTPVKSVLPLRSSIVLSDDSANMSWLSDLQLPEDPQKVPLSRLLPVEVKPRRASTGSQSDSQLRAVSVSDEQRRHSHPEQSRTKPTRGGAGAAARCRQSGTLPKASQKTRLSVSEVGEVDPGYSSYQDDERRSSEGSHLVLPPIQSASREGRGRRKLSELEEIILKNAVQRQYDVIVEHHVQSMLAEMRRLDVRGEGLLEIPMAKQLLRSYHLNFTPDADQFLLVKFENEEGRVKYENLVAFLISAKLMSNNISGRNSKLLEAGKGPALPPPRRGVQFSERDEQLLLTDLAAFMRVHDSDRQKMCHTLYQLDCPRYGYLDESQVKEALATLGLGDMPESLLQRLCLATDRSQSGLCDIEKLIKYFERARPGFQAISIPGLGENHKPRNPKEPRPVQEHVASPEAAKSQSLVPMSRMSAGSALFASVSSTSSPHRAPALSGWLGDFAKLTAELRRHDNDGTGFVTSQDAERTADSFNTIYDLQLSSDMLHKSLRHAHNAKYDLVNIEQFTDSLKRRRLSAS